MQIDDVESIPISHRSSKGYLVEQEISWTAWMIVGGDDDHGGDDDRGGDLSLTMNFYKKEQVS